MSDSGYAPSESSYWIPTLVENQPRNNNNMFTDQNHYKAQGNFRRDINRNPIVMTMDGANRRTNPFYIHSNQQNGFVVDTEQTTEKGTVPISSTNSPSITSVSQVRHNVAPQMTNRVVEHDVSTIGIPGIQKEHIELPIGFGGWSPTKGQTPPVSVITKPKENDDIRKKVKLC